MRAVAISGPDAGHLLPVVAVADGLRARGFDAVVVTGLEWRPAVVGDGFDFVQLPRVAPETGAPDLGWAMWGRAAAMTPGLVALLEELDADVAVVDTLTSAGGFAAERCGVPWVEVVPHWLWAPSSALPPVGLGKRPGATFVGRLYDAYLRWGQARSFAAGRDERRRSRRRVGLPASGGPALTLLATVPALEPPRPDWPRRTYVTGALEWEPPTWPRLDPPPGDAPLVLVTDSTSSGIDGDSLAGLAVRGLGGDAAAGRLRLVATTTRSLAHGPGVVVGRGRHSDLLDVAACAVAFGGGGVVAKALSRGVPLVLAPLQGDQRETAARIEWAGAGTSLDVRDATPSRLRDAVGRVLEDPGYRRRARHVAWGAAGLGPGRAARLVERHVSGSARFAPTS